MNQKQYFYLILIPILIYLFSSFFLVKDYGIMIDDPEQFGIGHKNLNYCLTGKLNYQDKEPKIKNHPNFYNYIVKTRPHHVWPFTPMLSAATCKIFFEKLNLLPPVPAHHFVIPILTALFFLLFFFFVRRWWGDFAALCSILLLMTFPRFFGHSLSNIKDLPEVLFFSLTIIYFVDWYLFNRSYPSTSLRTSGQNCVRTSEIGNFFSSLTNELILNPSNYLKGNDTKKIPTPIVLSEVEGYQHTKYLYLSFVFFGLAFATKADAIFVIPILCLWLLPDLINNLIKNSSVKIRTLMHFVIGSLISFLLIFLSYPQLQPWFYNSKYDFLVKAPKFIYALARYVVGIGGDIDSTWNLYSIKQIFYTTPTLMLLFFAIGFVYVFIDARILRLRSGRASKYKILNITHTPPARPERSRRVNLLLLIWLLLPILRHCMPKVNHYDGLRHFMIFMVPFVIITTIGIINFAKFVSKKFEQLFNLKQNLIEIIILILIVLPNLYSVISVHPYQTTFYNKIVEGLGGAQKKDIPFSSDYWFNSNLEAGEWLNKNAKENSNVHGSYIDYYLKRKDLKTISLYGVKPKDLKYKNLKNLDRRSFEKKLKENTIKIPNNTYIIEIPRKWYRLDQKVPIISEQIPEIKNLEIVYQIKRQDGIISTIYYKP